MRDPDRNGFKGLSWADRITHSPRDHKRLLETLGHKQTGDLLEVGCGRGGYLSLADRYFRTIGLDRSHRMPIWVKRSLKGTTTLRTADIEVEELGARCFDVVAAFNVLEHLHAPGNAVRKIYTGLRDRGVLIGSVPNNHYLLGRISTVLSNIGDPTHVSTYPPGQWREVFQEAGFNRINFFGELLFTKYIAFYIRHPIWLYCTYNLMFVCRK